jgi:ankyrin repeat protein
MSSRDLPARPHLDHLKNEAKALHKAFADGDPAALQRVHAILGDAPKIKLTDAQRVVAREYGFPTWARLREHVETSRGADEAVAAFLAAVQEQDAARALRVLDAQPGIATKSIHVAASLGLANDVARLVAEDPSRVAERAGSPAADPLLFLCYSPFHGESAERDAGLLAAARRLLDAGADPNTLDGQYRVPALYAVTGQRSVLPIARLLLDAGANPTDGESVFHAAENFHEDALDLLLSAGVDLNKTGEWGNTALYFLLRYKNVESEGEGRVFRGFTWLLNHGADPNVPSGKEREGALHVAARRGQSAAVIRLLIEHGADVNARREDGSSPWLLARRSGFDEIASLFENAGAKTQLLSPLDLLLAACGHGDADAARRLSSPEVIASLTPGDLQLLPESLAEHRDTVAMACLAAGFPVSATDGFGSTALHQAAIRGGTALVRALLDAGADIDIRDNVHSSTPLGWATFGADFVAEADGDYEGTVRALLDAGATRRADEYYPKHAGVRAILDAGRG